MAAVLTDLINANFKNLQKDPNGNMIYTLLPIVDEKENKKVKHTVAIKRVLGKYKKTSKQ